MTMNAELRLRQLLSHNLDRGRHVVRRRSAVCVAEDEELGKAEFSERGLVSLKFACWVRVNSWNRSRQEAVTIEEAPEEYDGGF